MILFRSTILHTPGNPFHSEDAFVSIGDGALAVEGGKIAACADFASVRHTYPEAEVRDMRDGILLPGFVDTHIHFPQVRIRGALGYSLLDWLTDLTFPEEARMADVNYARVIAGEFTENLVAHGTTTALVFGAHFKEATAALFDAAARKKLRVISGLVLSDQVLDTNLRQTPDDAYRDCRELIDLVSGHPLLGYAVIPRFAVSASEAMLTVCRTLLTEFPEALFTTHINENLQEIEEVRKLYPGAADYLDVYEECSLISRRSVLAHNVHATDAQLPRLASAGASIAHCPSSNAVLGSGIFPMRRHLEHGVSFALGTDVGAGPGFSIPREAIEAHLFQRVAPESLIVTSSQMLYLATRAGAEALNMEQRIGDFGIGKSADFVWWKPQETRHASWADGKVREVYVEGALIHDNG